MVDQAKRAKRSKKALRDRWLKFRATDDEIELVRRGAAAEDRRLSDFMRVAAKERARQAIEATRN